MLEHLTLYELNNLVRETIEEGMNREYWVEAELSEIRESRGHCYMELVQYVRDGGATERGSDRTGERRNSTPIARASAKCWQSTWSVVRPYFERVTGQQLHVGMQVLLQVYPQFHEAYGFSWIVTDVNPEFTLGDMIRKRQEIIRLLKEEGVYDLQKELKIPIFAQRIAVISSATAAGYGDFCHQLQNNEYGFAFHTELFPAVMQGEQVETSVIAALDSIKARSDDFDVVVIIRGGGATADLSGFDTLTLAENVANFPLPIITGIGHERDESVLDMISNLRVKTPTAAAAYLIAHLKEVYDRIADAENSIYNKVLESIRYEWLRQERLTSLLSHLPRQRIGEGRYLLQMLANRLGVSLERLLEKKQYQLSNMQVQLDGYNPQRLLQRGYSITTYQGKVLRESRQLKKGDKVETRLGKGSFHSVVTEKSENSK